jgi:four helix bundle protein
MNQFRFEQFEIWQMAIEVSDELFDIADELDEKRLHKFAEQLRSSSMSITNNVAEGSGSFSNREFSNFLNIAHRSTFECANILVILLRRGLIPTQKKGSLFDKLELLSRKITNFRKSLK